MPMTLIAAIGIVADDTRTHSGDRSMSARVAVRQVRRELSYSDVVRTTTSGQARLRRAYAAVLDASDADISRALAGR